jgi:hypothetical protein
VVADQHVVALLVGSGELAGVVVRDEALGDVGDGVVVRTDDLPPAQFGHDLPVEPDDLLVPAAGGEFKPWMLMPNLPLDLQYARASLARKDKNATAALRALRKVNKTRRGLSDDQLRLAAETYESLVAEGEQYPVKALAALHRVDKSTASRWLSAARDRGLLRDGKDA